jgi:hypothetical protein
VIIPWFSGIRDRGSEDGRWASLDAGPAR